MGGRRITHEEFVALSKQTFGEGRYTVLGQYIKKSEKILIRCNECGFEFMQQAGSHLAGYGCAQCAGVKKLTHEEWVTNAEKVHGVGRYTYLGRYVIAHETIMIRCNVCEFEFEQQAGSHTTGCGCPSCAVTLTSDTQKFIERAIALHGDRYDYSKSVYTRTHNKVIIICRDCGVEFRQTPAHHLSGQGCPSCGNKKIGDALRKSQKDFLAECVAMHGPERYDYSRVVYVRDTDKVEIGCKECGRWFQQNAGDHARGRGCLKCGGKMQYTHEEFVAGVITKYGEGRYTVLGQYENSNCKILVRCEECKLEFTPWAMAFVRGHGCPKCAGVLLRTHQEFIKEAVVKHGIGSFEYLTEYVRSHDKITIRCSKCNREFEQISREHLTGKGCPHCKVSHGERLVAEILNALEIKHVQQKKIKGCKLKKQLLFDFFLPGRKTVIEFQGRQHYEPVNYFGGEEGFRQTQKRDQVKRAFCQKRGIRMIEIPYTWEREKVINYLCDELNEGMISLFLL